MKLLRKPCLLALLTLFAPTLGLADEGAPAESPLPMLYLGVSAGGNFVLTDWDFGELDKNAAPLSPETSLLFKGRLGLQVLSWLHLEGDFGYLPFKAGDERNAGFIWDLDALFMLRQGTIRPFLAVGVGEYFNTTTDTRTGGEGDTDGDFQGHWGLGVRAQLTDWLWARADARHVLSDSLDADLPTSNNIELTGGLDFRLWPASAPSDRDHDGIIDEQDKCPDVPGVPALNGCPDRDGDGITDADDKCPDAAGPAELQGCPDRDNDGIIDADDKCPDEPGPAEREGCPAPADRDGDGIPDATDLCPDDPEDKDGIEDANGCPEDDADHDGILDVNDKCPLQPETKNEFEDEDGCADEKPAPTVVVTCEKFELNESIYFETGKATIQERSFGILDTLAKALADHPEVKSIRIEGHTDDVGSDASNNRLSTDRAKAVLDYLIGKSVEKKRLTSKGYGESRPIVANDSDENRAKNRRVDFVIVKADKREGCN